jgi:membrane protein insertase Oxa1/YidC/SpoIIIJ
MEHAGRDGARSRSSMLAEIARIKKHYRGRERYFYIRTIHRQFGHSPLSIVFSSAELYLQILIFATVYRFIRGHESLSGSAFLFLADLSEPDGLLFGVNVLPIMMTLLNLFSALMYSQDKVKRRNAFLLAGLFLALLYTSPSGLVLYWTSNNAFSLIRNFVERKLVPALPAGLTRSLAGFAHRA